MTALIPQTVQTGNSYSREQPGKGMADQFGLDFCSEYDWAKAVNDGKHQKRQ